MANSSARSVSASSIAGDIYQHHSKESPPGLRGRSHTAPKLDLITSEVLLDYFLSSWDLYEWLFSGIDQTSALTQNLRPNPFRNNLAFYYGHTAAFYAEKLRQMGIIDTPISEWDTRLATGVWPKSAADVESKQNYPTFHWLKAYRNQVQSKIIQVIDDYNITAPIDASHPLWSLVMGIEHERIHFQTSLSLIRSAPLEVLTPPESWTASCTSLDHEINREWMTYAGGQVTYGRKPAESDYYGWDNEFGVVDTMVKPFRIVPRPITNREYSEFVDSGCYLDRKLWNTPEAEIWHETTRAQYPASWKVYPGGEIRYREPFRETAMPWDWPVEVCKHEAAAYALWAGCRLISEPEYHYLLHQTFTSSNESRGSIPHLDLNFQRCSPRSVRQSTEPEQVDLFGNVALWSNEAFAPLKQDEFKPHSLYPEFSTPWFRGDHSLLLGAGYCATGHLAQIGMMRDFMQNHMDQVAGITLVQPL